MRRLLISVVFVGLIGLWSISAHQSGASSGAYISRIESAHGADKLRSQEAIQGDLVVDFGGQRMIDGSILFTTDGGRSRITLKDGTVAVFDGQHAWVSPASSTFAASRFHLLTWPYFALVPFKLRDAGTTLVLDEAMTLNGEPHATAKLTFAAGTGDAPDDWYILYSDRESGRLNAMAYIVTYGKKPGEADKPHAIVYEDFQTLDGVTISTTWKFYNWSREKGPHGEMIGHTTLRNVRFVTPQPDAFDKPADAKDDPLPKP